MTEVRLHDASHRPHVDATCVSEDLLLNHCVFRLWLLGLLEEALPLSMLLGVVLCLRFLKSFDLESLLVCRAGLVCTWERYELRQYALCQAQDLPRSIGPTSATAPAPSSVAPSRSFSSATTCSTSFSSNISMCSIVFLFLA